jgi:hypothetical protein
VESRIGIQTPRKAIKILALLVESGVVYILIGVSSAFVYKHELSWISFSSQIMSLASMASFIGGPTSTVIYLVAIHLAVRDSFYGIALELY